MPFNGSGAFTLSDSIENGTLGDASEVQNILVDIGSGFSNCLTKDGQQTVTNDIPMNGFSFTGMGPGAARTDSATIANMQDDTGVFVSSVSGSNAITLSPSPAISAYTVGQKFRFIVATTNTSSVTVAISGLAAKSVHSRSGSALLAGDLLESALAEITYDGTQFVLSGGGRVTNLTGRTLNTCVLQTCVVGADPTVALGIASKQYVDAMWTTGDIKITLKSSPDTGWVFFDDGTIGSASSGASTRANADTEALFTLLWNFTTDSNCAVSSGRGVSAASDFAANKTIALPKVLGRALAVYGTGSGLTSRALADAIGSENAINVAHDHTATQASHTHTWEYTGGGAGATATVVTAGAAAGSAGGGPTAAAQPTITVASSGSSGSGANMQPTVFFNLMVKL
jgi:microcystin-dependent protein